jgi:hypothetical protein
MYRFYDEKEKIREIQKYLSLSESGNYNESTEEAIRLVQKRSGIIETGKLDLPTFEAIYREYSEKQRKAERDKEFGSFDFPIKIGSYGEPIRKINYILLHLSRYYGIQTNLRLNDFYGERVDSVLEELSVIYGHEKSKGELDEHLYLTLLSDFAAIKRLL